MAKRARTITGGIYMEVKINREIRNYTCLLYTSERREKKMNNSGDAAEQIVRFGFEGAEVALKITGAAAKNIAAMLYAVLKDQKRTRGKARLDSMIREGKQTAIYTVKKDDCPNFAKQAKKYGIKYSPIPVKKEDKSVDIMVFEDDAVRANRIVEKFNISAVKSASITNEVEEIRKKQQAGKAPNEQTGKEQSAPEKSAEAVSYTHLDVYKRQV